MKHNFNYYCDLNKILTKILFFSQSLRHLPYPHWFTPHLTIEDPYPAAEKRNLETIQKRAYLIPVQNVVIVSTNKHYYINYVFNITMFFFQIYTPDRELSTPRINVYFFHVNCKQVFILSKHKFEEVVSWLLMI